MTQDRSRTSQSPLPDDLPGDPPDPRHPSDRASGAITAAGWAALLARWTEFARASVAFPKTGEGRAWAASVAPAITLQAVTFALGDLESLDPAERPLALDRAGVLLDGAQRDITAAWSPSEPHDELLALIRDARQALHDARRLHAPRR